VRRTLIWVGNVPAFLEKRAASPLLLLPEMLSSLKTELHDQSRLVWPNEWVNLPYEWDMGYGATHPTPWATTWATSFLLALLALLTRLTSYSLKRSVAKLYYTIVAKRSTYTRL